MAIGPKARFPGFFPSFETLAIQNWRQAAYRYMEKDLIRRSLH